MWQKESEWPVDYKVFPDPSQVLPCDPEVKKVTVLATKSRKKELKIADRLEYFSDWFRARRAIALSLLYLERLREQAFAEHKVSNKKAMLQVQDLQEAKNVIIKSVQCTAFPEELKLLSPHNMLNPLMTDWPRRQRESLVRSSPPHITWIPSSTRREFYALAAVSEMLHSHLKSSSL